MYGNSRGGMARPPSNLAGQRRGDGQLLPASESRVKAAADLDRESKAAAEVLRGMLLPSPWTREVESQRQGIRNNCLTILFSHPRSPFAQTLDPIWHLTTYNLIAAYRELIARTEPSIPPQAGRRKPTPQQVELRKILTRFRQALASEESFYRSLISRLVTFYQLQDLSREFMVVAGIPVGVGVSGGGVDQGLAPEMGKEEKKEKLALVYKGLICLGDLERYKEQYSDRARREKDGVKDKMRDEERYAKARMYYEVARGLIPSEGSAFNQLAVISTYTFDDLFCVYYYFRAVAVKQAFKNGEVILDKFLKKLHDRWRSGEQASVNVGGEGKSEVEEFKRDFLVVVATIYRRSGLTGISALLPHLFIGLGRLLRERHLPSEGIVKIAVIAIGVHWYARSGASVRPAATDDDKQSQKRQEAEEFGLLILLEIFGSMMDAASDEVEEASRANESAVADDNEELHQHISAVLRRILPTLRIMSKWIKLHLDYVSRFSSSPNQPLVLAIGSFWQRYRRLISDLASLFPIEQLPLLSNPLEEDNDMRGFIPLTRGLNQGESDGSVAPHDAHPNEEQLMRISDLQVDAKLLMQTEVGYAALMMTGGPAVPSSFDIPRESDDGDLASVSTETEDDPVNLAMRATLGESSTDEADDDEEIILLPRSTPMRPVGSPAIPRQVSTTPAKPTAHDLLQTLMLDANQNTPQPAPRKSVAPVSIPGQSSPGFLFGGDTGNSSIWTMTREESQKGVHRSQLPNQRGSAGNLAQVADLWNDPAPVPLSMAQTQPQQFGAPTWTSPAFGSAGPNQPNGYPVGQTWSSFEPRPFVPHGQQRAPI